MSTLSTPMEILLVEDNPGDVRLTQEAFKEADIDVNFHAVKDGVEGQEYLFQQGEYEDATPPDLVLLDLNLPQKDGHELLTELRAHSDVSHVPVIVLTSSDKTEDVVQSYKLGANAYLTKPTSPDEFVSLARTVEEFWVDRVELPPVPA